MRVLLAIESCHNHRPLHDAQRQTWIKDIPPAVDYKFFVGNRYGNLLICSGKLTDDEVQLPVDDSYDSLSLKTRDICRWATYENYDYLYKADIDTLVHVPNLLSASHGSYWGGANEDDMPPSLVPAFGIGRVRFASGGAGYWLSQDAMQKVADGPDIASPAEDVYVASILALDKIFPMWHNGYRWRPGETVDKEMASLHLSSTLQKKYEPEDMYSWYEKMKQTQR